MWRWWSVVFLALAGCPSTRDAAPAKPDAGVAAAPAAAAVDAGVSSPASEVTLPAGHHRGRAEPLPVCDSGGLDALSAARRYYDQEQFEDALSCAAQASALYPDNPLAHSERGAALAELGQLDAAQTAYARALALDPDHLDALLGAAHLYAVRMPSSRERDELAAVYAERGLAVAQEEGEAELRREFALISAMAFNDLGLAQSALERAEQVLARQPRHREAQYERAVALFELCRFAEAKAAFAALKEDPERGAHAHHHLGLLLEREGAFLEREGAFKEAETHFARARKLAPQDFAPPQLLSEEAFRAEVEKAVASLPPDMRRDLEGIPVRAEELPVAEDLLSGDPPLSPAILGLFRGPPLGEPCDGLEQPCRSVALYRRNLARAVRTRKELVEQIRVTLLHEVGHLRGEDDHELAARGLE